MNVITENRVAIQFTKATAALLAEQLTRHDIQFVEDTYDEVTGVWDLIIKFAAIKNNKRIDKYIQIMANDWVVIHGNGLVDVFDRYWRATSHINEDYIDGLYETFGRDE